MKRLLLFSALVLMTSVAMTSHLVALFNWRTTTHDFGRVAQHKPVTAEFSFTNKGEVPLVINQVKASCGCTGVDYAKQPILPGQTGTIKATYNATAPGAFNKTVQVESNAEGGMVTLSFKGEVVTE